MLPVSSRHVLFCEPDPEFSSSAAEAVVIMLFCLWVYKYNVHLKNQQLAQHTMPDYVDLAESHKN